MGHQLVNLAYVVAGILFILGLKGLTHPRTAVRGNLLGAIGMLVAIVATLCHNEVLGYVMIILGLIVGSAIGAALAFKIEMTAMPQLVALFNGLGGSASVLVAYAELVKNSSLSAVVRESAGPKVMKAAEALTGGVQLPSDNLVANVAIAASGLIAAATLWGLSLIHI